MSGRREGGLKAAVSNKAKFGDDFYHKLGQKGGRASRTGGFYGRREAARIAGAIGGTISRRTRPDGSLSPLQLKPNKPCTFCLKTGHTAYTCGLRANIKRRKAIARSRRAVELEAYQEDRNKLSAIARKWAKP